MEGLGGLSPDWFKETGTEIKLLGNHEAEEERDPFDPGDDEDSDFSSLLDDLNSDLSANPNASGLFKRAFKIDADTAPTELLEAMSNALREDVMKMRQIVEEVVGPRPNLTSVIPRHIGRKEALLLSQGFFPLFYPAFGPTEKPQGDVIIYIDVSGSMGSQAPFLLMLLTAFQQHIGTEFYQFSTEIAPTNFQEFRKHYEETGEIFMRTTGGTSFDPIFEHAKENGFNKILLITDGCANLSHELEFFAESIEVYTVFTLSHQPEPLSSVSTKTWVMPDININKETGKVSSQR
jgi:hypothetical protein